MADTIVFDIETKKSFEEVGGRDNLHLLGISVIAAYSYNQDKFFAFDEQKLGHFEKMIEGANLLVGFNIKGFDIPVLNPYIKLDAYALPILDLMDDIKSRLGFRVSLDNIARNTLGISKTADGLQALRWYKEGKIDEIKKYCVQDVKVTKEIYEFGKKNGHILFLSRETQSKIAIPVSWSGSAQKNIHQILKEAFEKRKTAEIDYVTSSSSVSLIGSRNIRLVDIYKLDKKILEGYCHLRKAKRIFKINRILQVKITNKNYQIHEDVQESFL
jgi:DEAD/DEAH box helicase domain-containing protein